MIEQKKVGSYIASPDWIKTKNANINPINDDDKRFQYITTVTLITKRLEKTCKEYQKVNL